MNTSVELRMRYNWENCRGRKREAKANASEQSGQSNELCPSEQQKKRSLISVLTTAPSVQKEAELPRVRALVAML